jgi:hypothetical protein
MMQRALALTDEQLALLQEAASQLLPRKRGQLLEGLANELGQRETISNRELLHAINLVVRALHALA